MVSLTSMTFEEFWPRYLAAHRDPRTRALHTVGTIAATSLLLAAIAARKPWLLLGALLVGYGPAWYSHAMIEGNRPETFRAPIESLKADYRMAYHVLCGTIEREYARIGENRV